MKMVKVTFYLAVLLFIVLVITRGTDEEESQQIETDVSSPVVHLFTPHRPVTWKEATAALDMAIGYGEVGIEVEKTYSLQFLELFLAVAAVESGDNIMAYNEKEDAAGVLQIRPICLVDCNRIVGYERWGLFDRYIPSASFEMFSVYTHYYMNHYDLSGPESAARIWNGGPRGWEKESTLAYWKRVEALLTSSTHSDRMKTVESEGNP